MIEQSLQLKIIAIFEIFLISAIGAYFPQYIMLAKTNLKNDDNNNNDDGASISQPVLAESLIFRGFKCFSGGLIVAVAFCHLLQDSIVALNENIIVKDITYRYPLAMSLAMSGVIFLVCLEQMTLVALDMVDNYEIQSTANILSNNYYDKNNYYSIIPQQDEGGEVITIEDNSNQYHNHKDNDRSIRSTLSTTTTSTTTHLESNYIIIKSIEKEIFIRQYLKLVIFECSVALHSVIIGFNLGILTTDSQAKIKTLMIGLSFHQFFEGFSLGTMIIDIQKLSWNSNILFIIIYALTTPIGIMIGIMTSSSNTTSCDYMNGIFNGLASGFLIYAGLIEILHEEFTRQTLSSKKVSIQQRPFMCISMILGAAFMTILAIWT